jgi:hypothetical protein
MSTYKNTSGDLTLTGNGGVATLTINYANTVFNGSLTYTGNLTTVDDFIVVGANNTGVVGNLGLLAGLNVTTNSYAGLRFNADVNAWQISANVYGNGSPNTAYANIVTGSGTTPPGGSNTQIQFNDSGSFGATANLTFDKNTNRLTLTGHQALANVATPANVSNSVVIYSNAVSAGGTGLYFTSAAANDELVSKSKAIVFSIIF